MRGQARQCWTSERGEIARSRPIGQGLASGDLFTGSTLAYAPMTNGQCLCGDFRFRIDGDLVFMHHCHCGYCRKSQGSAYSTMIGVDEKNLHWDAEGKRISFESSTTFSRSSCGRCGSPLPVGASGMPVFVPTGLLDGDFGHRAEMHIFVESKLPWLKIRDGLPCFDAYPPGLDAAVCESRVPLDPPGGVRGSCLCGRTRFAFEGSAIMARHCHCKRCQRARGAAHASNLIVLSTIFRWTAGASVVQTYRVPDARFFAQAFCGHCGSCMPRIDDGRGIVIIPLGALDDPPPTTPRDHIWVESKASWHEILDDLPQFQQGPPG